MKIKLLFIFFILAIIFISSISFVKAQSVNNSAEIAQLQAEIAQLSAQLLKLQAQQQNATPATSTWCYNFSDKLKMTSRGDGVLALQTALLKEKLFSDSVTKYFGKQTQLAVIKFQEKYASDILTPNGVTKGTGIVGQLTIKKLNALYGCPTVPTTACTPNWQCGWGPCISGYQSQVAFDSNKCGVTTGNNIACPALAKACASN